MDNTFNKQVMTEQRITTFQAGIIFSTSVVLFLLFSFFNPFESFYVAGVVIEVVAILMPSLIGLAIFKKSFIFNLKLRPPGGMNTFLSFLLTLIALPITLILSAINVWLVQIIFGTQQVPEIPLPSTGRELLISLLVIALVPAICEEVLNRGILQTSLEKFGKWPSIIVSSILFTLLHFSYERLLGIFFLSLLIGYVVYLTKSIFTGMMIHFTNNAVAMILSYGFLRIEQIEGIPETPPVSFGWLEIVIMIVFAGGVFVFASALLFILLRALKNRNKEPEKLERMSFRGNDIVTFIPGLLLMGGMFFIMFLAMIASRILG